MAKAKFAIITDTHLKDDTIDVQMSLYRQAYEYCRDHNLKLFHGGDIFDDRRKIPPIECWLAFGEILNMSADYNVDFHLIAGNHDKPDYTSWDSFIDVYEPYNGFIYKYGGVVKIDDVSVFMFPYLREDMYAAALNEFIEKNETKFSSRNVLITHVAVNGARNNDGSKVDNQITGGLFDRFDRVYVGHYHQRQNVNSKIHYIGAGLQHNFGESEDKGLIIINDDLSYDVVELDFPRYKKLSLSNAAFASQSEFEQYVRKLKHNATNDRIHIDIRDEGGVALDTSFAADIAGLRVKKASTADVNEIESIDSSQLSIVTTDMVDTQLRQFCESTDKMLVYEQLSFYIKKSLHV